MSVACRRKRHAPERLVCRCPEFSQDMWPGVKLQANYSEELLIGYRCYDAKDIEPAYPFGHGLSFTTWSVSDLQVTGMHSVSAKLSNTGHISGAQVLQLYLGFPSDAGEPPKQLKSFKKVALEPGQQQRVTFEITDRDLSIWDFDSHSWARFVGEFKVFVGTSSRDPKMLTASLHAT